MSRENRIKREKKIGEKVKGREEKEREREGKKIVLEQIEFETCSKCDKKILFPQFFLPSNETFSLILENDGERPEERERRRNEREGRKRERKKKE